MDVLPMPRDLTAPLPRLVEELVRHLGQAQVVARCVEMLVGEPRAAHTDLLPYLTGVAEHDERWLPFWDRAWGARALLYAWDDRAVPTVVAGLADEHWRPAENCLKVVTRREIGGAGDGAARLLQHERPRVRAQALRALGAVGDTEHVRSVLVARDDPETDVRRQAARALDRLGRRLDWPELSQPDRR